MTDTPSLIQRLTDLRAELAPVPSDPPAEAPPADIAATVAGAEGWVKARPLTALGISLLAGTLFGALWTRRTGK